MEVNHVLLWQRSSAIYSINDGKWLTSSNWNEDVDKMATLAVTGGNLVAVGSSRYENVVKVMKESTCTWTKMKDDMKMGCNCCCVVSVGEAGLLVMGGLFCDEDEGEKKLSCVQVYDGKKWAFGDSLPEECHSMSAAVHGDLLFLMGGNGMNKEVWCTNTKDLVRHLTFSVC